MQNWRYTAVHCVAYLYEGVVLGWKPEKSTKFRPILATQETLTDFHGDEAKKIQNPKWSTQKPEIFNSSCESYLERTFAVTTYKTEFCIREKCQMIESTKGITNFKIDLCDIIKMKFSSNSIKE